MQCFIGLTFSDYYLQFNKIDIYRRRFDTKYTKSNVLQLTLLPPFEIQNYDNEFIETLSDELDGHLEGLEEINEISFNGVDFNNEKKGTVFLRPELPLEFQYCQQSLWELIKDFGGEFNRKKPVISEEDVIQRAYLPIARTKGIDQFEFAIETAKDQFEEPFQLRANGISIFETTPGQWILRDHLYQFDDMGFDFSEMDTLKGQIQALYV